MTPERQALKKARRIVVKIGSRVLTDGASGLDFAVIADIAAGVATLKNQGHEVIIVSSGAVAAGRTELGLPDRPKSIPQKQAAAAIGQTKLMRAYEEAFSRHGGKVAQVLLTGDDLASRLRFLNARATLDTLLAFGVTPVINENDTVVVDEIKLGDNDNLSALVTNLVDAQLLVIMSDIDGFFDADPRTNPAAKLVPTVRAFTKEVERAAGGSGSSVGTGGMATKIAAAKKTCRHGVPTVMLNGRVTGNLVRAVEGAEVGTLFLPGKKTLPSRKHWIAYSLKPKGRLVVDAGAQAVLSGHGRSLLPSGVVAAEGDFDRGACVRVCAVDGTEFARGIVDYAADEISRIMGHKTAEIEDILGYRYGDEIIHRDNLVVL